MRNSANSSDMNGYDDKDTGEIFDNVNTARILMKKRRKQKINEFNVNKE